MLGAKKTKHLIMRSLHIRSYISSSNLRTQTECIEEKALHTRVTLQAHVSICFRIRDQLRILIILCQ